MNLTQLDEEGIFQAARKIDAGEARSAYLNEVCGGDRVLRDRLEALLHVYEQERSFLESPPIEVIGSPVLDMQPLAEGPGAVIGPYKLREQIGEGGMGVVYAAEQTQPVRRKVALKIIKPGMDTRQVIARFEAERQALAMMDHPNIAKVHDGGATDSGRPYFVMELVRGIPITEYCDRERLSIPQRLELFVQVCRAVQHAHQKGIIHRDLKPSNILVTMIDGSAVPKVIDFGVAKATGASLTERTIYTAFHQFLGTPLYMSPEQADLSGMDVDTRSDIYSLGVLLYELLTGTTPFDENTFREAAFDEIRRIIREQEPPKPSTRLSELSRPHAKREDSVTRSATTTVTSIASQRRTEAARLPKLVRGELDWIVMKALEKDRKRRYETANDFASDVMRYLTDQPVQACPPSAGYRLRKFVRRNKGAVGAGVALAALLVLGTVGTSIGLVWALKAERRATLTAHRAGTAEMLATNRLLDVSKEKERATAAEGRAKDEAAAAEAVVKFLQDDLLAQAAPEMNPLEKKVTVEELLGRAAARIEGKFAQQPRVESGVRRTIANTYIALDKHSAARPHLERAWALCRGALGEEDLDSLTVLTDLAGLYARDGQVREAEQHLNKVLTVRRRVLGEEHPDTLGSMLKLSQLYLSLGWHSEAEKLLVTMREIMRRVRADKKGGTLGAMNYLAVYYLNQRRYVDAEALLTEVLDVQRHLAGEENSNTLTAMNNLLEVYANKGDYPKAADLLERVLKIGRRIWGDDSQRTLLTMNNLGRVYWSANRLDRSVPLFEEVVPKFQARFGPDGFLTIMAMLNLGINYRDGGRLPEAIAKLEQAWEWDRKRNGPKVDPLSYLVMTLADSYDRAGQFARSEPLYRAALEVTRERHGEVSLGIADALAAIGLHSLKQQKYADAEPLFRECLIIREQKHPDGWKTFNTKSLLGGSLMGQKKYAEAEPLLQTGYDGMKKREAENRQ
jgi:eukaryotic-like serine/threonine-protein kinase